MLSDEAVCDVSSLMNDQYYSYQICWSIIHGALDPDLQLPEVGPCVIQFKMDDYRLSNSEILRLPR